MIPVQPAAEPANFDATIRTPGNAWLAAQGWAGLAALPPKAKVRPFWSGCRDDLLAAYDRICAYASLRIHPVTGAQSVEHFAPKSRAPAQTYEWSNYRLACAKLNARKNNFTDVIDPFLLEPGTFELNVLNGSIRPSAALPPAALAEAVATIKRLKLDDGEMRSTRLGLVDQYLSGEFNSAFLQRESPFIWLELQRLNMLRP